MTIEPRRVLVPGNHLLLQVLGNRDEHLKLVERAFPGAVISARGNEFTITGTSSGERRDEANPKGVSPGSSNDADRAATTLQELVLLVSQGQILDLSTVARAIDMVQSNERPSQVLTTEVMRSGKGRSVKPKTSGQKRYAEAIANNIVTIGIGPAGSGKSYLAVALAVQALQAKQVARIILTRPAVEAGERLGFLPGDLMAKIDPYLRPLYDALYDMLEPEGAVKLIEKGTIEVAPLAFMRGRTLNNSFIILDEAQNTTPEQMKMFLTRIGFGSKAVITGDVTQVDLRGDRSGLVGLERILGSIEGMEFVHLDRRDVVRHRIVADIVDAYERAEAGRPAPSRHNQAQDVDDGNPAPSTLPLDPQHGADPSDSQVRHSIDPGTT